MKHPLTSKERRGLVAVAAAALLCIASGPLLRRCGHIPSASSENGKDSVVSSMPTENGKDSAFNDSMSNKSQNPEADKLNTQKQKRNSEGNNRETKGKSKKKSGTKKAAKEYPVRSPLDQPCD